MFSRGIANPKSNALQQQRFFISSSISWKLNALTLPQQRFLYIFKSHEIPRYPMGSHGLYHSRDFYIFLRSHVLQATTSLQQQRFLYVFKQQSETDNTPLQQQRFLYLFKWDVPGTAQDSTTVEIFICFQARRINTSSRLYYSRDFYILSIVGTSHGRPWDDIRIYIYNSKYFYIFSRILWLYLNPSLRQQRFLYVFKR